jgi:hypothetical protein
MTLLISLLLNGEVNAVFNSDGLKVFTDGTFTVNNNITYIRSELYNAEDFRVGGYISPWGSLIGSVNCELQTILTGKLLILL